MEYILEVISAAHLGVEQPPLVVNLDGTLIKSDILIESFFRLLASRPWRALQTLMVLFRGIAAFKKRLAASVSISIKQLPVNEDLLAFICRERSKNRRVYLVSAADRTLSEALAAELGVFDGVIASDGFMAPAGAAKAAVLCETFGDHGFDYAGSELADFPVWEKSREALVVSATPSVLHTVRRRFPQAVQIGQRSSGPPVFARALRLHQWVKNLLIFVPTLAAHQLGHVSLLPPIVAFFSFSCAASSAYLLNDLLDLPNDRMHRSKRHRPLASGQLPLASAIMMFPVLLLIAVVLATFLPINFMAALGGYFVVTMAYSLWIKRRMTADVITLACLYGLRVIAGGAAEGISLSPWLIAFATFVFLSLAIVKRCTELIDRVDDTDPAGRGYLVGDLPVLEAMAVASGYVAVMVFALYLNTPVVVELYRYPERLWLICVVLLYWLSRLFIKMRRGEMHADPIVFAVTDRASLVCAAAIAVIFVVSS
jgi:4-hydroxybenzoate polyprenyltransferase